MEMPCALQEGPSTTEKAKEAAEKLKEKAEQVAELSAEGLKAVSGYHQAPGRIQQVQPASNWLFALAAGLPCLWRQKLKEH
jgi:hypothetical protein